MRVQDLPRAPGTRSAGGRSVGSGSVATNTVGSADQAGGRAVTTLRSVRPTTGDLVQFGGSVQLGRDECRRTHHVPLCRLRQRRRRYGAGRMSALALLDPAQARPDNELRFQVERSLSERSAERVSTIRVVRRALLTLICFDARAVNHRPPASCALRNSPICATT